MKTLAAVPVVLLGLATIPGCQRDLKEPKDATKPAKDLEVVTQQLKDVVEYRLKDPESARYRNLNLHRVGQWPALCGEVNAKNSFGGYIGHKPFMAGRGTFFTSVIGGTLAEAERSRVGLLREDVSAEADWQRLWEQLCH